VTKRAHGKSIQPYEHDHEEAVAQWGAYKLTQHFGFDKKTHYNIVVSYLKDTPYCPMQVNEEVAEAVNYLLGVGA